MSLLFFSRVAKSAGGSASPASRERRRAHGERVDAGCGADGASPVPAAALARPGRAQEPVRRRPPSPSLHRAGPNQGKPLYALWGDGRESDTPRTTARDHEWSGAAQAPSSRPSVRASHGGGPAGSAPTRVYGGPPPPGVVSSRPAGPRGGAAPSTPPAGLGC